jgi:tripartite-type tricarboxylate transporter receptor subunit TctC
MVAWSRSGCWRGLLTLILALSAAQASAEPYPTRTITIITPFAAGSVTDAAARMIGQSLQDALGQSVVVENRAGAGGLPAANAVARAKPDGYTLFFTTNSTHSAANGLYKNVPYDPIKDFTPIARIGSFPSFVAVNPELPVNSIGELMAYAKANPGKLSYGVGNSTGHIAGETIKKRTGTDIVRVNYRSNPAMVTDLIAGHIPMAIPDFNTGLPQLKTQKVRALAVLTKERNRVFGCADVERDGHARFRHSGLGRHVRPGEPAARDREGAGRCRGEGAVDAACDRTPERRRHGSVLERSAGVLRFRKDGAGEMDRGDQGSRHRAGMNT